MQSSQSKKKIRSHFYGIFLNFLKEKDQGCSYGIVREMGQCRENSDCRNLHDIWRNRCVVLEKSPHMINDT